MHFTEIQSLICDQAESGWKNSVLTRRNLKQDQTQGTPPLITDQVKILLQFCDCRQLHKIQH